MMHIVVVIINIPKIACISVFALISFLLYYTIYLILFVGYDLMLLSVIVHFDRSINKYFALKVLEAVSNYMSARLKPAHL